MNEVGGKELPVTLSTFCEQARRLKCEVPLSVLSHSLSYILPGQLLMFIIGFLLAVEAKILFAKAVFHVYSKEFPRNVTEKLETTQLQCLMLPAYITFIRKRFTRSLRRLRGSENFNRWAENSSMQHRPNKSSFKFSFPVE